MLRQALGVALIVAVVTSAAVASAATRKADHIYSTPATLPLRTAIMDPNLFVMGSQEAQAFSMTRAAGATYVRVAAVWSQIAPTTVPPGFTPSDPDSPGYDWSALDSSVEGAEAAGLTPIIDVANAPVWALAIPKSGVNDGTPKITAFGNFARAIATHYDGRDGVPAAHVFQAWNEPNLSIDLTPPSAVTYRKMVNAFAAGVHGVDSKDIVVAGGLDPFKNHTKNWHTIAPLAFMRSFLCVSKGAHPHATCKTKVHFDVWSHHPYTFGGPFHHARLPDDVSLGDLPRMTALLRNAVRLHRIASARPVQFWVTEFGWDTDPPNPTALKINLQARGVAEAFHQMWINGISLVTWFLLQDEPSYTPYQTGLYFGGQPIASAQAKPTLTAFRFPFVAYLKTGAVSIWGRDATSSSKVVTVQLRHGKSGSWKTVARVRANRYGIFLAKLPLSAVKTDWLRAIAPGSGKSLAFSLTEPKYPLIGPWGN